MSGKRRRVFAPREIRAIFQDEAEVSGDDTSDENYDSGLDSPGSLDDFIDDSHYPDSPVRFDEPEFVRTRPPSPYSPPHPSSSLPEAHPEIASSSHTSSPVASAFVHIEPEGLSGEPEGAVRANFRLQSKAIFLTYPQCDFPHTALMDRLKQAFPDPLNHFLVSREKHEDGSWHLHCLLDLHKKLRTRRVNYFDDLVDPPKHPNIKSKLQSKPATIRYIVKGGDPELIISTFDYQKFLDASAAKRSTKATQITALIKEGKSIDDIDDLYPEYVLLHGRQLREYAHFKDLKARRRDFVAAQSISVNVVPDPEFMSVWNCRVADWLTNNIRKPRAHRQLQLWISAPPRAGKTSLIMWLESTFRLSIYFWPKDEHWWDGYSDKAYDLIILDEFRSQKKITELNPILSGDPTPLSRRSSAPLVKRDLLPVIILSNFNPSQCFHKCSEEQLAPLMDRLLVVDYPMNGLLRFIEGSQVDQIQAADD